MNTFRPCDFYLLRSPKLPISILFELGNTKVEDLEQFFYELYSQVEMQEAIMLASPDLYYELKKWLNKKQSCSKKLLSTLYKYTARMSTRCTPFGQFSGTAIGRISTKAEEPTKICRTDSVIKYRLDMQSLASLAQKISLDPDIRTRLTYYTNSTIYCQEDLYKFYQSRSFMGKQKHFLSAVSVTTPLEFLITACQHGMSYQQLIEKFCEKGVSFQQAVNFIDQVIESQILVSEFRPIITGEDFLSVLKEKLKQVDYKKSYLPTLKKLDWLLRSDFGLHERESKTRKLLENIGADIQFKNILQGDQLICTKNNTLGKNYVQRISNQLQELMPLASPEIQPDLVHFKEAFKKRYDRRIVPLLEALDPDTGIGYGRQMVDYLQQDDLLCHFKKDSNLKKQPLNDLPYQELVLRKYCEALQSGTLNVSLNSEDLENLNKEINKDISLACTFYAIGNILEAPENSENLKFNFHGCGGVSASNLMTRFAYLDETLEDKLKKMSKFEQQNNPNSIFAEIVYLPEARTGNILQRPKLRDYEIVLFASSCKETCEIKVNDLYLFMKGQRLVLWSKILEKEIIPRITSAHNYHQGIYIYRFLGDLQSQENGFNLKWEWSYLSRRPFLPRVSYKDIIISRARWYINKQKTRLFDPIADDIFIQNIINELKLPRFMTLSEGDNELPLDLTNQLSRQILLENIIKKDVVLYEFLFKEYNSPVLDSTGKKYSNEVIIPFKSDAKYEGHAKPNISTRNDRLFPPGDKWIYVNIYCGHQYAETILRKQVRELINNLKCKNCIKKWFFIRFKEPEHHIRLRVEAKSRTDFSYIVQTVREMFSQALEKDLISNLQLDTYKREIERYTADHMDISEELFLSR